MANQEEMNGFPVDSSDTDDVEIIEVVAVDEDDAEPLPSLGGGGEAASRDSVAVGQEEGGEFVLSMDEDEIDPSETTTPASGHGNQDEEGRSSDQDLIARLRADYENLRKRIDREREEYRVNANSDLLGRLLPVLDNFERALGVDAEAITSEAFRSGLALIHHQLNEELRREGLETIESVGGPFDPNLHDAVATESSPEHPPNTVIEEFQRGYLFRNRLLRPAMVKVSTNAPDLAREQDRNGGGS